MVMTEKFVEIMRMPKGPLRASAGSTLVRECRIAGHSFAQIRAWISKANDILMDVDAWLKEYADARV